MLFSDEFSKSFLFLCLSAVKAELLKHKQTVKKTFIHTQHYTARESKHGCSKYLGYGALPGCLARPGSDPLGHGGPQVFQVTEEFHFPWKSPLLLQQGGTGSCHPPGASQKRWPSGCGLMDSPSPPPLYLPNQW